MEPVPEDTNSEKITVNLKNGVLIISIEGKKEDAKGIKVE